MKGSPMRRNFGISPMKQDEQDAAIQQDTASQEIGTRAATKPPPQSYTPNPKAAEQESSSTDEAGKKSDVRGDADKDLKEKGDKSKKLSRRDKRRIMKDKNKKKKSTPPSKARKVGVEISKERKIYPGQSQMTQ